jgi:hypothetical protein
MRGCCCTATSFGLRDAAWQCDGGLREWCEFAGDKEI